MMIKIQATLAFAAALSVSAGATDDSNTPSGGLRRGNHAGIRESGLRPAETRQRLRGLAANPGPGELVCEEDTANEGSVLCSFRVVAPTDTHTGTILHDCHGASSSSLNNLCYAIDLSRVPIANVQIPATQPSIPPAAPIGIGGELNSIPVPSPIATTATDPSSPPTSTPTEEFVSPIVNLNPGCPAQSDLPFTGDECPYEGTYYSCEYITSWDGPFMQCRCNDDGIFYCRAIQ